MTEDQAKTKWCPMVRMYDPAEKVVVNRPYADAWKALGTGDGNGGDDHFCIGSECMMWRTVKHEQYGHKDGTPCAIITETTDGYCGLAGKP